MAAPAAVGAAEDLCQGYSGLPAGSGPHAGMVCIEGGSFTMGDDGERTEESAAREATVGGFWIDRHEVTNAAFARFVAATGYVTVAERGFDPKEHPGMPPELLAPGAVVFTPPDGRLNPVDVTQRWRYPAGADWRHPPGPTSSIEGGDSHPVVNVAYKNAEAYARWLRRELPTEAQWGFAARGRLDGAEFAWGRRGRVGRPPDGEHLAGGVSTGEPQARRRRPHLAVTLFRRTATASTT
jgi:formylglycine-generating enzyme